MLCHVFWSQVEYKIVCFTSGTGGGGGERGENEPHQGFSSVIFARGMITKQNFG